MNTIEDIRLRYPQILWPLTEQTDRTPDVTKIYSPEDKEVLQQHLLDLVRMIQDDTLYQLNPLTDNAAKAPALACTLLTALSPQDPEIYEQLIAILDKPELPQSITDNLTQLFQFNGPYAVSSLKTYACDVTRPFPRRSYALNVLVIISSLHQEHITKVTRIIEDFLQQYKDSDDPALPRCYGELFKILALVYENLQLSEYHRLIPQIKTLFANKMVDSKYITKSEFDAVFGLADLDFAQLLSQAPTDLIYFQCHTCNYVNSYRMDLAFYDYRILRRLFTKEQNVHISPIWIPYSITCKRCHDIDSYEISCRGYIELLAEALRRINASEKEQTYKSAFRPIQFDFFEQEMHPLAAFERCRQNIAKDPNDIDSRLTLAMLLFLIRDNKKAKDRLMECIKINPKELSPYLALTQVLEAEKNWHEACQWWLAIRHIIPKTNLDEQNKRKILQQCDDALARMGGTKYANVSPQHKVGRNDPCPCGSNKKYKKCCLTK